MSEDLATGRRGTVRALLLLIVIAGACLRFYGLDAQSLWNDELSSWQQSHQASLADVIEIGVRPTPYPPLYQALLYYVENGVGDSEKALRFPSALAGTLAILAIFFLGRSLYTEREGLIAATLLAFSYQPLYYSQEARSYSLLLLFAILSSHFWFRLVAELDSVARPKPSSFVAYLACAAGAIYLHYFGLLLVAIQLGGLFVLFVTRPRALAWVAAVVAAVALAYVPWLPYFVEEFSQGHLYLDEPNLGTLVGYWRFLFYNPGEQLKWFVAAVFAVAAVHAAMDRSAWASRSPRDWLTSPTLLLVAWLVLPVAAAYVRSKTATPMLTYRNLLVSLPPAFLLLARALTRLLGETRLQALTVGAIVAVLLYGLFVTGGYYRLPRKEQFREAAAVVTLREAEFADARVVAHAWSEGKFDYYLERTGATSRVDLLAGTADDIPRLRAFLAAEQPEHVWFVLGHRQPEKPFMTFLDRELELVFHEPFYGAFTRLYRRRALGPHDAGSPQLRSDGNASP